VFLLLLLPGLLRLLSGSLGVFLPGLPPRPERASALERLLRARRQRLPPVVPARPHPVHAGRRRRLAAPPLEPPRADAPAEGGNRLAAPLQPCRPRAGPLLPGLHRGPWPAPGLQQLLRPFKVPGGKAEEDATHTVGIHLDKLVPFSVLQSLATG